MSKIEGHLNECYEFKDISDELMQKQESAQVIIFVEKEMASMERKRVVIHITGFREKLEPKVLLEHRESIVNKHYEGADYLSQKLLVELPPTQMPRLD